MSYLSREQTIRQWAELVTQTPVHSMKQIQQSAFTCQILQQLDPQYFTPIFTPTHSHPQLTFSQIFAQISKYYSTQIGTDIRHIMGQQINIYSLNSIEDIWQLVLGIAIKGRNRQRNINTILKMRPQTQEELMRIISKIIAVLGENVSTTIEGGAGGRGKSEVEVGANGAEIIFELSEENEMLREKVEELAAQVGKLKEQSKMLSVQLDTKNKESKRIIDLLIKQPLPGKSGISFSTSSASSSDFVIELIKDMMMQVAVLHKQLTKKQQKQNYLEEINKDLKKAYATVVLELDQVRSIERENNVDLNKVEKQIEELRNENMDYAQRERGLLVKIGELEEQKFYLKGIVERLQAKNNMSEDRIEQIVRANKVFSQAESQPESQTLTTNQQSPSRIVLASSIFEPSSPAKPVHLTHQINELQQPSARNKLQREIGHLQKKINILQQQNNSLRKINQVLEKTISDFTRESAVAVQGCEQSLGPLFEGLSLVLAEGKAETEGAKEGEGDKADEGQKQKERENQSKIREILAKMRHKIEESEAREIQYIKSLKKSEIQRDQLLKTLQIMGQTQSLPAVASLKPKPTLALSKNQQLTIDQSPPHSLPVRVQPSISVHAPNTIISSFICQLQQQPQNRPKRPSFFINRQSHYQYNTANQQPMFREYGQPQIEHMQPIQHMEQLGRGYSMESADFQAEGSGCGQVIDISQIEEQLLRIRESYESVGRRAGQMCEIAMKRLSQQQPAKSLAQLVDQYKDLPLRTTPAQQPWPLQPSQSVSAALQSQVLRLKHQNTALQHNLHNLQSQHNRLKQKLLSLQRQLTVSPTPQATVPRQQLLRISSILKQLQICMLQSQAKYIELEQYWSRQGESSRVEVEKLARELRAKDHMIEMLKMEIQVLMGPVLEFRGMALRGWQ